MGTRALAAIGWLMSVGCSSTTGTGSTTVADDLDVDSSAVVVREGSTRFEITYAGQIVGEAEETATRRGGVARWRRIERLEILRGTEPVMVETDVVLEASQGARVDRILVSRTVGQHVSRRGAKRSSSGWRVGDQVIDGTVELLAEVVRRLAISRTPSFRGKVMIPAASFAVVTAKVDRREGGFDVELSNPLGTTRARLWIGGHGEVIAHQDDAGTASRAVAHVGPIKAVDVLSLSAVRGRGTPGSAAVRIDGLGRAPPLSTSLQRVTSDEHSRRVDFGAPPTSAPARVARLVSKADRMITDDLTLAGVASERALSLRRGDCTAHASAFVALARDAGMTAHVVTGFRRADDGSWYRHRWAQVTIEGRDFPVDPTFNEAVVERGRHLALARHGDTPAEIAAADLVSYAGWTGASIAYVYSPPPK